MAVGIAFIGECGEPYLVELKIVHRMLWRDEQNSFLCNNAVKLMGLLESSAIAARAPLLQRIYARLAGYANG